MGGLLETLSALNPFTKSGGGGITPAQEDVVIYEEPSSPTGYVNEYNEPVDKYGCRVNASLQPVEDFPGQLRGAKPAMPLPQAGPVAGPEVDDSEVVYSSGAPEKVKHYFIRAMSLLGGLTIWVVLSLGNFQLFNNFGGFSWTAGSISALVGGFVLEGIGLSLLFVTADHYRKSAWGGFIGAGLGFLFFAVCSTYTQYELLSVEMARGELVIPAQALVGQIISDPRGMLLLRALMYNVGEVFLVFLITKYEPDAMATAREKIKIAQAKATLAQATHVVRLLDASNQIATGVLQGQTQNVNQHMQAILHGGIVTQEPKVLIQQVPHLLMLDSQQAAVQGHIPPNMATGIVPDAQPIYTQVPASMQRPVTAEYRTMPAQPVAQPAMPPAQRQAVQPPTPKAQASVTTFSDKPGIKETPEPLTFASPAKQVTTDDVATAETNEEEELSSEDKLQLAVQTMLANPRCTDEEMRVALQLRRAGVARFYRIKAQDMIARHNAKNTGEQEKVQPAQEQVSPPRPFLAGATSQVVGQE